MADAPKKHEEKTDAPVKPERQDKKTEATHKPAAKTESPSEPNIEIRKDSKKTEPKAEAPKTDAKKDEPKATEKKPESTKAEPKKEVHREQKEAGGKHEKKTGTEKKTAEAARRVQGKTSQPTAKKGEKEEEVKIVDKPAEKKHVARAKANLSAEQKKGLQQRREISDRRPWFKRQQWYEYKRLGTAWRKPTGMDSAMRRHFGYEQSVVRVGFGGPKAVRGLHPSGFREVYVDQIEQLKGIDVKTQAARVSGTLGTRKLKLIYAEADKLGVRILNRRTLQ